MKSVATGNTFEGPYLGIFAVSDPGAGINNSVLPGYNNKRNGI
jgi:hypothetical protein